MWIVNWELGICQPNRFASCWATKSWSETFWRQGKSFMKLWNISQFVGTGSSDAAVWELGHHLQQSGNWVIICSSLGTGSSVAAVWELGHQLQQSGNWVISCSSLTVSAHSRRCLWHMKHKTCLLAGCGFRLVSLKSLRQRWRSWKWRAV